MHRTHRYTKPETKTKRQWPAAGFGFASAGPGQTRTQSRPAPGHRTFDLHPTMTSEQPAATLHQQTERESATCACAVLRIGITKASTVSSSSKSSRRQPCPSRRAHRQRAGGSSLASRYVTSALDVRYVVLSSTSCILTSSTSYVGFYSVYS